MATDQTSSPAAEPLVTGNTSPELPPDEAFLRRLLSASPDGVAVLDLDARLVSTHLAGQRTLETQDGAMQRGRSWLDGWSGPDREAAASAVADARTGETGHFEGKTAAPGEPTRWWDVTVSAIPGADGSPQRLLAVSRDVTARRDARDVAAERGDRLRFVIESVADYAIISIDADGNIDQWNRGAVHTFGWTAAQAVGRPFNLIWTAEDQATGSPGRELKKAEEQGVAPDDRWHMRADGTRVYVSGATRPVRDAGGALTGFVKVCRDETEQRRTEQALVDAHRRSDAALLAGEVGTFTWEIEQDRVFGDTNFTRLFGLHPDPSHPLPLASYLEKVHPDDRAKTATQIQRTVTEGVLYQAEYRIVQTDGSERWVVARGELQCDAAGRPQRFPGVLVDITTRKRAEEDRERLAAMVDVGRDAIFTLDLERRVRTWNAAAARLFGYTADEMIGRPIEVLCPPDRVGEPVALYGSLIRGEQPPELETVRCHRDGTPIDVSILVAPMFEQATGRLNAIAATVRDIGDRKRVEIDRARLAEHQRLALDSADLGWWHVDTVNGSVVWDDRAKEIFGVASGRLPYERSLQPIHPDDRDRVAAAVHAATRLHAPERYRVEYRVVHADGSLRWVRVQGRAYFTGVGAERRLTSFVGTVEDITAARNAAEARRDEQEQLRTIFEQAPDDAILVMDADRRLSAWNPAAQRITGWSASEAVGQSADLIFTPEERAAGVPEQEAASAAANGKTADDRWHLRKNGTRFWASGTMNALHHADGRIRGYLKVFRDATDRHTHSEALAFLSRMTAAVIDQSEPDGIITTAERMLAEHLGASRVLFAEITADGEQVIVRHEFAPGLASVVGTHRIADFGPAVVSDFHAGRTHVSRDAERDYTSGAGLEAVRAIGARAGISVPVLREGKLSTLVVVHQAAQRDWAEGEIALVRQVADRVTAEVERSRALRELRRSEAEFRQLADAMPQIVWAARPDGVVDYYNQQWYAYTGLPRGMEGHQSWNTVIHPDDLPVGMAASAEAARTGKPLEIEARYRRGSDGAYRWFLARALPVHNEHGQIVRWFGTNTDIHDKKSAAETAARREFRLAAALAAANLGTFDFDLRSGQVVLDARSRELFGFDAADELTTEQVVRRIAPKDLDRVRTASLASIRDRGRLEIEFDVQPPGGPTRTIVSISDVAVDSGGEAGRVFGVFGDVTERRRMDADREHLLQAERAARSEAEQAGRMKDEFLATLSHELRTPLNAIVGWTQILRTSDGGPEDLAEGLAVIDRNARAQTQIIEDILDMSRIISGKLRLDVQAVNLAGLVRAGVDTVQPAADAKGVRLQLVLDPAAGPVTGDPNRLHQVFWNLLSNAVKFTPKGGRVQVTLERVNSHVEVSVLDTGEGIDRAFLPHVFDRFRQADATTTRRHGGLGLGLAIVKQLIELHGGGVRVKSPGKGQGSTFIVRLPLTVVHPDPQWDAPAPGRPAAEVSHEAHRLACDQLAGVRVLVVDDEADARFVVQRLLEACGAKVDTANSTEDAVMAVQAAAPAVLVSDIGMPGEDGHALIRRVRALPPEAGGRVGALALTAYARSTDRIRALEAGFQMHLAKPVNPAELVVAVAALARRSAGPG